MRRPRLSIEVEEQLGDFVNEDLHDGKMTHLFSSGKVEGLGILIGVSGSNCLPRNKVSEMTGLISEKGRKVCSVATYTDSLLLSTAPQSGYIALFYTQLCALLPAVLPMYLFVCVHDWHFPHYSMKLCFFKLIKIMLFPRAEKSISFHLAYGTHFWEDTF